MIYFIGNFTIFPLGDFTKFTRDFEGIYKLIQLQPFGVGVMYKANGRLDRGYKS